ncbi:MAG: hypothetical protein ACJKTH_02350 [Patescibacteria group bacterium UBA2163]
MKSFLIHLFILALFVAPSAVMASSHGGLNNPLGPDSISEFFTALLGLIAQIAFPVVVLFIIFIGFRFVQHSATGDAEGLKKDREYFLWALVGALLVLGAQALSFAIEATVNNLTP